MDKSLLLQKTDSIARCILRVEEKRPQSEQALQKDIDSQDIIALNLERAVQQCVDIALIILAERNERIPATMNETFDNLRSAGIITAELATRMQKAVGFRNIAVHAYRKIDWNIVWKIITEHLNDFRHYSETILEYVNRH